MTNNDEQLLSLQFGWEYEMIDLFVIAQTMQFQELNKNASVEQIQGYQQANREMMVFIATLMPKPEYDKYVLQMAQKIGYLE